MHKRELPKGNFIRLRMYDSALNIWKNILFNKWLMQISLEALLREAWPMLWIPFIDIIRREMYMNG